MKLKEIYSTECPKCGAPLKRDDDKLICEYCNHIYAVPQELREKDKKEIEIAHETRWINININSDQPPIVSEPDRNKPIKRKKLTKKQLIWIMIYNLIFWPSCIAAILLTENNSNQSEVNPETAFINRVYSDQFQSQQFPAGVDVSSSISVAVVLVDVSSAITEFDIIIKNNTERIIENDSRTDHLDIDTFSVTDNLAIQDQYTCQYKSEISYQTNIAPGEIFHSGNISCINSLPPEVEIIHIDMDMPNWGQFHIDIPTPFDPDTFQIDYQLILDRGSSFNIKMNFYSSPPQLVSIYKKDISIFDDIGRQYSIDNCIAFFSKKMIACITHRLPKNTFINPLM